MSHQRESYERLIYSVSELSYNINKSDLIMIPVGKSLCIVKGNIFFNKSIRLEIREALDFALDDWITGYCYTVYEVNKRLYWYDSQGHPNDPDLQVTHPHHKHIPPDIKHNRIPASGISFNVSNLSFLIQEVEKHFF